MDDGKFRGGQRVAGDGGVNGSRKPVVAAMPYDRCLAMGGGWRYVWGSGIRQEIRRSLAVRPQYGELNFRHGQESERLQGLSTMVDRER